MVISSYFDATTTKATAYVVICLYEEKMLVEML